MSGETFFEKIQSARKLMIDPPSGWAYGFPDIWDKDKYPEVEDFLKAKGYPQDQIEFTSRYLRMWLPQEKALDELSRISQELGDY